MRFPLSPFSSELRTDDFGRVADTLRRHCGISLGEAKRPLVAARLAGAVRRDGDASYTQYLDRVLADPAAPAFAGFVDALSTNQTQFFREPQHFDVLRDDVCPALARGPRRVVRGWSAGCSSGEEPYSLAMTLADALPAAAGWDVKVLATDLSTRVLAAADAGVYPAERVAAVGPVRRRRWFRPAGEGDLVVGPALRAMVRFRHLNLMEAWPFRGPMDFVFCRNVMIYFDRPTRERLVNRFYDCLRPGGVLMVGHSESLSGLRHPFRDVRPTVYRR